MSLNPHQSCKKGFTLVEVIVTAVIVAILASVAIPIYLNYIVSQRQATVEDLAKTGAASANSFFRRTNSDPDSSDLNLFIPDASRFKVSVANGAVKVQDTKYTTHEHTVPYK